MPELVDRVAVPALSDSTWLRLTSPEAFVTVVAVGLTVPSTARAVWSWVVPAAFASSTTTPTPAYEVGIGRRIDGDQARHSGETPVCR